MTEKDKNPFADLLEQTTPSTSQDATDIDFSFFDAPAIPAASTAAIPVSTNEGPSGAGSDLSFLETLIPTKPEAPAQPSAQVIDNSAFSFDDDEVKEDDAQSASAAMPAGQQPDEKGATERKPQEMLFACLKCAAKVAVDFPETAVSRFEQVCPSCLANVVIVRESSAQRASRKAGAIYCSTCSQLLNHHPHCPGCGLFCPDYYLVEDPKEAQRKAKEARSNSFRITVANLKASLIRRHDKREPAHYEAQHHDATAGSLLKNKKMLIALALTIVILVVAGISSFLYLKHKQEQRYVSSYVKAIYALHSGMEDMKAGMTKTAKDWQAATEGGRIYTPRPDSDTSIRLAKTATASAKLMQQLQEKTPKKYEEPHAKLMAFNAEFNAVQSAFMNPSTSFMQFSQQIENVDKSVKQKAQELKSSLPKEMVAELDDAKKRYRGFAGF